MIQVGGIKEKVLAAHRAGISHVIIPQRNKKDLRSYPKERVKIASQCFNNQLHGLGGIRRMLVVGECLMV